MASFDLPPETLAALEQLAQADGTTLEALIDEAFSDLIEKRRSSRVRPAVMQAYFASHEEYAPLYKKLAQ
jgi:hypothetical protein